jgi:hypothetical protein
MVQEEVLVYEGVIVFVRDKDDEHVMDGENEIVRVVVNDREQENDVDKLCEYVDDKVEVKLDTGDNDDDIVADIVFESVAEERSDGDNVDVNELEKVREAENEALNEKESVRLADKLEEKVDVCECVLDIEQEGESDGDEVADELSVMECEHVGVNELDIDNVGE